MDGHGVGIFEETLSIKNEELNKTDKQEKGLNKFKGPNRDS